MVKIFRKVISLSLSLTLVLSLTSCVNDFSKAQKRAEKALDKNAYTVEVDFDFECADEEAKGIFEQLEAAETKVYFKDGKIKYEDCISIDYGEGKNTFRTARTVLDGVLYSAMSYKIANDTEKTTKSKAFVTDEQTASMLNRITFIGGLSGADFGEATRGNLDGESYIVYSAPCDSAKVILEESMAKQLEGASGGVELTSATLRIEIEDGKYDTVTAQCVYSVTIQGKAYTVNAKIELEFDFDESFDISVPADADEYAVTTPENIIG